MDPVFVTGGTGYIGRALIDALRERGYIVHALVRPGSEAKLPNSALPVIGNALDASTFASAIPLGATLVHLVGTPHPSPAKAAEFQRVDLASIPGDNGSRRAGRPATPCLRERGPPCPSDAGLYRRTRGR